MEGTIVNYRKNSTGHMGNQLVVIVHGIDSKEKTTQFIGKKAIYNTGKRDILGKISAAHAGNGALRAIFVEGIPGQAIGKKIKIE